MERMLRFEREAREAGYLTIAGLDEVGRGPLAGPVVAAAVIFSENTHIRGVKDSKLLTPEKRSKLFERIREEAFDYAVAVVSPAEIDELNILRASLAAMHRAVLGLRTRPDLLLIDGSQGIPDLFLPQRLIVKGDRLSRSIAAASILAKVTRDRILEEMEELYPGYGFARHKGYATFEHLEALHRLGPSPIHRLSFRPVCECLSGRRQLSLWGEEEE